MRLSVLLLSCVSVGASLGCSNSLEPEARVSVRVAAPVVQGQLGPAFVQVLLAVEVRNDGLDAVVFEYCGTSVERRQDGGWTNAWSAVCSAEAPAPGTKTGPQLAAGRDTVLNIAIHAARRAETWPENASRADAYRVIVGLVAPSRGFLERGSRTSNEFGIEFPIATP